MLPTISSNVVQPYPAMSSAARGMNRAEKAFDADADSIASGGPTVENMVDLTIQPEVFAANAQVVSSASQLAGSTFNMLA
jgi:hypothetical protein